MTSIEMEGSKIFWPWIFLLMLNMTDSFPDTPSVTKISSRREELNLIKSVLSVLDQLVKDLALKMEIIGGELHAINGKMPSYLVGENKEIINNITSITVENKRQNATILQQEEKQQALERKLNDFIGECRDIMHNITSIAVETERQDAAILQHEVMQQSLERKWTDIVDENKNIIKNITSITVENERQNATILQHKAKQESLERKLNIISKRVAFSVTLGGKCRIDRKGQIIVYRNVIVNMGEAYNSMSGIFETPVTGLYAFFFSVQVYPNSRLAVILAVNGAEKSEALVGEITDYNTGSNMAILPLKKGDRVWIQTHPSNDGWINSSGGTTLEFAGNSFSGYVIA